MLILLFAALQIPVQHFPELDRVGADPAFNASLRAVCNGSAGTPVAALLKQEAQAGDAARGHATAGNWRALGCARALLSVAGARSREGLYMPTGESWNTAALGVFRRALALQPDDQTSADALALLAADEGNPDHPEDLAHALATAVGAGVRSAPTLRSCVTLNLRNKSPDVAAQCATIALAAGFDSTEHLLTVARLRFRIGDTVGGTQSFLAAVTAAHDTLARADLAWHLQWFLWPAERALWDTLPDAERTNWIDDRLRSRDIRDGQPVGARLAEHFKRLEYVEENFRLSVPRVLAATLRGGSSARDTVPLAVELTPLPPRGQDQFPIDQYANRAYRRWQIDFDDRGVIWMRYGAPLHRVGLADSGVQVTADGGRLIAPDQREVWTYRIDGNPLVLTFSAEPYSGSVGASRLITGFLGTVDCMGGVDDYRCSLAMNGIPNRKAGLALLATDQQSIAAGTTRDDNSPRTGKSIGMISRLHRLWDPTTLEPITILTYALPVKDLLLDPRAKPAKADVTLELRRWNGTARSWQDTTFGRALDVPNGSSKRVHVTGFVQLPSSAGVTSWSLVATQPEDRHGRAFDVTTPAIDRGAVALSDLVLGQAGQGITWHVHGEQVQLAPLNALDHRLASTIYYQVRSERPRNEVRIAVALFPVTNTVRSKTSALDISYKQNLKAGLTEFKPEVNTSRLPIGDYIIQVRVIDPSGTVLTKREVAVSIT